MKIPPSAVDGQSVFFMHAFRYLHMYNATNLLKSYYTFKFLITFFKNCFGALNTCLTNCKFDLKSLLIPLAPAYLSHVLKFIVLKNKDYIAVKNIVL